MVTAADRAATPGWVKHGSPRNYGPVVAVFRSGVPRPGRKPRLQKPSGSETGDFKEWSQAILPVDALRYGHEQGQHTSARKILVSHQLPPANPNSSKNHQHAHKQCMNI